MAIREAISKATQIRTPNLVEGYSQIAINAITGKCQAPTIEGTL